MNYCRTCKYWSVRGHAIGVGLCLNVDLSIRMIGQDHAYTCQDFGCVLHEQGECGALLESKEERVKILGEFIESTPKT